LMANMLFISFLGCFFDIDFHDGLPFWTNVKGDARPSLAKEKVS
jgi:hypothetical protein